MRQRLLSLICVCVLTNFFSCTQNPPEKPEIKRSETPPITGVSVWDRIAARSEASRSSPRASLLSLGESFLFLDSVAIDSAHDNTRFLKVRLSDSSQVWVYDFASVLDAKPAAITSEVPLYMRPDLLTISDTKLKVMEIVAVVEEWDDWIKIVNEKKEHTGWIKKEFLTYNTIDLAFALLVRRILEEEAAEPRIEALEDLLENNPYPNTLFLSDLRTTVEQEKDLLREEDDDGDRRDQFRRERNR